MVFDVPAGSMKARRRHVLPLSDVLVELTERRQAAADSTFLFPARPTDYRPLGASTPRCWRISRAVWASGSRITRCEKPSQH